MTIRPVQFSYKSTRFPLLSSPHSSLTINALLLSTHSRSRRAYARRHHNCSAYRGTRMRGGSIGAQSTPSRDLLQGGLQRDRFLLHLLHLCKWGEFYIPELVSCRSLLILDILEMHAVTAMIRIAPNRDEWLNSLRSFVELYRYSYCAGLCTKLICCIDLSLKFICGFALQIPHLPQDSGCQNGIVCTSCYFRCRCWSIDNVPAFCSSKRQPRT
jgi:hypothetical protein